MHSTFKTPSTLLVLLGTAVVGAVAISGQSYWIDEALSVIVAMAPTPAEAWRYMQAVSGSTLQMPLYQIYLFLWHKAFGLGEWAMRASNLPWFLLAQLAFLVFLRDRPRLAITTCLLAAVSPILWIYLDETRPYLMQYAAASWLTAALVPRQPHPLDGAPVGGTTLQSPASQALFLLALLLLAGSSLLGVIWAAGFTLAALWILRPRSLPRGNASSNIPQPTPSATAHSSPIARPGTWIILLLAILLFSALGAYYLLTRSIAAAGYHAGGASILALPFIGYELLGFSGYGPGKLDLRSAPLATLVAALPTLLPLATCLLLLTLFALRRGITGSVAHSGILARLSPAIPWSLALLLPALVITIAFALSDHRILPRHAIPALPALLLALATLLLNAWDTRQPLWRATAVALPALWLISAILFRFGPAHAKDDYRTSSRIAASVIEGGGRVWWAADAAAAHVYQAPIALERRPGHAWRLQNPSPDDLRFELPPDLLVIGRPDVYDPLGTLARYATANGLQPLRQLQAITLYSRPLAP